MVPGSNDSAVLLKDSLARASMSSSGRCLGASVAEGRQATQHPPRLFLSPSSRRVSAAALLALGSRSARRRCNGGMACISVTIACSSPSSSCSGQATSVMSPHRRRRLNAVRDVAVRASLQCPRPEGRSSGKLSSTTASIATHSCSHLLRPLAFAFPSQPWGLAILAGC